MANDLIVKLGADTSDFKGAVDSAATSVSNSLGSQAGDVAGSRFATAFEHRLLGARHLSSALAVALGLNFEQIAENLSRGLLGFSKEAEDSLKKVADLSETTAQIYEDMGRKNRTDSQNLVHDQERINTLLKEKAEIEATQAARKKRIQDEDADSTPILEKQDEIALAKESVRLAEIGKETAILSRDVQTETKDIKKDEIQYQRELMDDVEKAGEIDRKNDEEQAKADEKRERDLEKHKKIYEEILGLVDRMLDAEERLAREKQDMISSSLEQVAAGGADSAKAQQVLELERRAKSQELAGEHGFAQSNLDKALALRENIRGLSSKDQNPLRESEKQLQEANSKLAQIVESLDPTGVDEGSGIEGSAG